MGSRYAAFLSYSHSADRELAAVVQRGLQRLGKPWYRRPTIKIFRDEASLSANPGLWSSIEQSLAQCDYFLLLASPDAARSPWVAKEVNWWRTNRPHEHLLIIVTDGQIAWDAQSRDFDWERTTCLSPEMKGLQREEPLHVDLRWLKGRKPLGLRDARFREAMLMLLAPIYGRPKDELDNEDIRQQHRFKFAVAAAALVVGILAFAALYGAWTAQRNFAEAEQNRLVAAKNHRESESRRLAAASLEAMEQGGRIDQAIILGVLAWRSSRTPEAESTLVKIQGASADVARILGRHTGDVDHLAFSGDSSVLATGASDASILLWHVRDWAPIGNVLSREYRRLDNVSVDYKGSSVLALGSVRDPVEGQDVEKILLWNVTSGTYRTVPAEILRHRVRSDDEILSPNGTLLTVTREHQSLTVWDTATQTLRPQIVRMPTLAARFLDDTRLIFLTYIDRSPNTLYRVGLWNIDTGAVTLGPTNSNFKTSNPFFYEGTFRFSGDGSKLLTWYNDEFDLWAVQRDLNVIHLQRPDTLPRRTRSGTAIFDRVGDRILIVPPWDPEGSRLLIWNLSRGKLIKLLPQEYVEAKLSPDGRWLAAVSGANKASVVMWDLDNSNPESPAHSLQAACSLTDGDCIQRLCEKVSLSIDETTLRDLLGDNSYEELDETLRTAPCAPD